MYDWSRQSWLWRRTRAVFTACGDFLSIDDLTHDRFSQSRGHHIRFWKGNTHAHRHRKILQLRQGLRLHCRSEEHTSELQSLMRISYAVFCLKKKNHIRNKDK